MKISIKYWILDLREPEEVLLLPHAVSIRCHLIHIIRYVDEQVTTGFRPHG